MTKKIIDEDARKHLKIILDALYTYKDYEALKCDYDMIDEMIGLLRVNLYGEKEGWHTKRQMKFYQKRKMEKIKNLVEVHNAIKENVRKRLE